MIVDKMSNNEESGAGPDYSCSICFDKARQPVVTTCGHLFCWPCLCRWLKNSQTCPSCQQKIVTTNIVPIYINGDVLDGDDERPKPRDAVLGESEIIKRPIYVPGLLVTVRSRI